MKAEKCKILADKTRTEFIPIGTCCKQFFRKKTNCNLESEVGIIGLCTQCGTLHKKNGIYGKEN